MKSLRNLFSPSRAKLNKKLQKLLKAYFLNKVEFSEILDLIRSGADVNTATPFSGETALHFAARDSNTAAVLELLKIPGIDVNKESNCQSTALNKAAADGNIDIVRALLAANSRVHHPDLDGNTALILATAKGHINMVHLLLFTEGTLVNHPDNRGDTALICAAEYGNIDIVNALLLRRESININAIGGLGDTAITRAFENGYPEIVRILQNHGAILPEHLRPENAAAQRINGNQSVHEVSVHASVSQSAKALRKCFNLTPEEIQEAITELSTWVDTDFSDTANLPKEYNAKWLGHAKRCVDRLLKLDFTDLRSGVSMQEALAYVWTGINNEKANGENTPSLSRTEITSRRITLLKHLYEIQRGYNLSDGANPEDNGESDEVTCVPGSFNKLIAALNEVGHVGVQIIFITSDTISLQACAFTQQAFASLSAEDRKRFAQGWDGDNSDAIQEECFKLLKEQVSKLLHEKYDEFKHMTPNFEQILEDIISNIQYRDMSEILKSENHEINEVVLAMENAHIKELEEPVAPMIGDAEPLLFHFTALGENHNTLSSAELTETLERAPTSVKSISTSP